MWFAFLRAVNVGGRTIKMNNLARVFEGLGFGNVTTFIASGNVAFDAKVADGAALERKIETALADTFKITIATFLRTDQELRAIAVCKPVPRAALESTPTLNVAFLASALDKKQTKALMELRTAIDDFHVGGREMYWLCKTRQSESTFSNAVFEKRVGVTATFRGINTVRRMVEKFC